MSRSVAELLNAALGLPDSERAELAELLSASLPSESSLHPAWGAEVRRRVAEIDSGRLQLIPWQVVREEVSVSLDGGQSDG